MMGYADCATALLIMNISHAPYKLYGIREFQEVDKHHPCSYRDTCGGGYRCSFHSHSARENKPVIKRDISFISNTV